MLIVVGNALVWIASIALPLIIAAPLALVIGGDRPARASLAWLGLVFGIVGAGLLFTHLAVDLPRVRLGRAHAIWAGVSLALSVGVLATINLQRFSDGCEIVFTKIARAAGKTATWLVLAMALVQFVIVILRYVFGVNSILAQESITYMHGIVFLTAAGYALLTDDHVRVDIFYREAPERQKALVNFIGIYLFLFPFALILLWTGAPYIASAWSVQEGSTEQSGLQGVYLLKSFIPLFAVLLAMASFSVASKSAAVLRGRADHALPADHTGAL